MQREPSHLTQDEGDLVVQQIAEKVRNGEAVPGALVAGESKPHEHQSDRRSQERRRMLSERKHSHRQMKEADDLTTSRRDLQLFSFSSSKAPKKRLFKPKRPPALPMASATSASDQMLRQPPQLNCAWQVRRKEGREGRLLQERRNCRITHFPLLPFLSPSCPQPGVYYGEAV